MALSTVVKLFGVDTGVHCEPQKGTFVQAKAYVTKDSDRVPGTGVLEWGVPPAQGKRKDLDIVRDIVSAGGGMRDVVSSVSSYQAMRSAELMLKYTEKARDFMPDVFWFYGSTGSGKTKRAFELFEERRQSVSEEAWVSGKSLEWFEGYDGHSFAIIDDFRKDFCKFHELLRLLDRYPYRVAVKGSSRQFVARTIVFTCPWHPEVLYAGRSDEDIGQLLRRIPSDNIQLFGSEVPAPVPKPSASVPHFRQS